MNARSVLLNAFQRAVAAAHPAQCLPAYLPPLSDKGRLILLAAGKAAGSMTEAVEAHYGSQSLRPGQVVGLAVTRRGYACPTQLVPVIEAGHPLPDDNSVKAAHQALEFAHSATENDLVLVLLSGGASANWAAPAGGLTLGDKRNITRHLLRSGAPIGEINAVRKRLSRIKGGRLAAAAFPASILTLAMSDVPGDDPAVIGSGPTVPDPITNAEALAIAQRYQTPLGAARSLFAPTCETPKPNHPAFAKAVYQIVMKPADMVAAAAAALAAKGYEPITLGADLEGEARDVAARHAAMARDLKAAGRRAAILSGGELTVTLHGKGRGGPNQEYALALALALDGLQDVHGLAADTDGTDGGKGLASDPAGALIDPTTLIRARLLGLEARTLLKDNDSTHFFEGLGDLLMTGPTYTNASDLRILLVDTKA